MILILHNIRSLHNIGSIFRTADAVGVEKIYLTGYTSPPVDRFGMFRREISKVALGAERIVPWEKQLQITSVIKKLRAKKCSIVAIEQSSDSKSIFNIKWTSAKLDKTVFIFGNEVLGLNKNILKQTDMVLDLPMQGKKESLNVSVAVGVALYVSKAIASISKDKKGTAEAVPS